MYHCAVKKINEVGGFSNELYFYLLILYNTLQVLTANMYSMGAKLILALLEEIARVFL